MRHLIGEYVTEKGTFVSKGKLISIDQLPGEDYNWYSITDFFDITETRGYSSKTPLRKSTRWEIQAAKERANREKEKAKEDVAEVFENISESEVKAEIKPYQIIDTPLNVVNDSARLKPKIYLLESFECESASFDELMVEYDYTEGAKSGSYDVPDDEPELKILKILYKKVDILSTFTNLEIKDIEVEIFEDITER